MKCLIFILILITATSSFGKDLGVGISLGNPTGVNGKYWLDKTAAVDGGLGLSLGKHTDASLHSDYLLHKEGAFFLNDVHPLDLYYGVGGRMEFADDIELGIRVPVGLAHRVENGDADVFGEIAPIFDFLTSPSVEVHFLFGARYYL